MRALRIVGALGVLVVALAACGSSGKSADEEALQKQADMYAIDQIEKTWHRSTSTQNVELMMTLFAPNATFTVGPGKTYVGKEQIRRFWQKAPIFQPKFHWVSETPAYKIRITVNGDKGTLYFECHFVDVATKKLAAVVAADWHLARIDGRWLITTFVGTTATLSP